MTPRYAQRQAPSAQAWFAQQQKRGNVRERESCKLTLLEAPGRLGSKTWPSALAAARWISSDQDDSLSGLHVLELGAGTGLCSLALAAKGATVLATDVDDATLQLVALAAKANHLGERIRTKTLDVCDQAPLPDCDLVVGCDLLYNEQLARAMALKCAGALRSCDSTRVLLVDPGRSTIRDFESALAAATNGQQGAPRLRGPEELGAFSAWVRGREQSEERLLLLRAEADITDEPSEEAVGQVAN